ncbi:hypothetical protein RUM44_005652 [Polyplax serrata]|uniref:Uncharacterized protein n=1 Tax=Polyplax serrata TaxID=468196 RepID=A0ABR1AD43_POLSC
MSSVEIFSTSNSESEYEPDEEENALSEEELARRAKRQKCVRDSEEIAAEQDVQELLAKVKPDACESATVEELKTMIESSALIVRTVACSSKNLKGTFVKSLKDAASVSAVAGRALERRMDPRPTADGHVRRQLEECQAVCLLYKTEMEELRGFKARYEELASKVGGHSCSCSNSGTSADPMADLDLLVEKLVARFQQMGYLPSRNVTPHLCQEEGSVMIGAKTPKDGIAQNKTPKEAPREKKPSKKESRAKKSSKEESRTKQPSKEASRPTETRVEKSTQGKKKTASASKPGKPTPAAKQTSTTPWTEVVKKGMKTTQRG